MTMKKFLTFLFAFTMVLAIACGGGGETAADDEEDDEEDGEEVVSTDTGAASGTAPAAVANAGSIAGLVKLEGTPAPLPNIQFGADPNCQAKHASPVKTMDVIAGPAGELANVFVYIKDYKGPAPAPSGEVVLDQNGCLYLPHVNGIQVGQTLAIKNSDPTLHNVHAMPKINREFNEAQPVQGMISKKKFDKPETMVKFKCDVHPWMNAYLGVLPHPYFGVSSPQGSFNIGNVPPGTYTVEAWHEKYGTQTQQVTVPASGAAQVSFTFKSS